ncbi:MAG: YkgJ family cysteine cluster protein [Actinomycetota bacterium]
MAFNTGPVEPVMLKPESRLKFRCHPGIECYTRCCSNIDILLTPYDIIRLKNRLETTSEDFLKLYTRAEVDEKSNLPHVFLKMLDNEEKACPFVTREGCTVYSDRPATCRYYPVGQATHRIEKDGETVNEEFYVLVREEHCLGFKEEKEWTIDAWRRDQEADLYDEINRPWKDFLMRRGFPTAAQVDEKKQALFYMASYNIDRFRKFVFESRFLEVVELDPAMIDSLKSDELELMKFGFEYLKFLFGMDNTIRVRQEALPKE